MPGLVGIISRMPRAVAVEQVQRMVASMLHEPFYVSGSFADENLGLYVGWALRDRPELPMPMGDETGNKLLVFSGEEFSGNFKHQEYHGNGSHPQGNFEILPSEQTADFLARLNGQFQGVFADRTKRTLVLFNDRYGLRRVHYHEAPDGFYFAAEAKAILAVKPELREADPRGVGEHLACGCVLENRTLFKHVYLLPPGSGWRFRAGHLEAKESYFSREEWENQEPMEAEPYHREVRETFARVLPRYFPASQQLGLSLTGGLDTRMILAWLRPERGSLPCYTFGGTHRESRDVRIARRVAALCGQEHQTILMNGNFLSEFSRTAQRAVYLSDGSAGTQHAPDLYINRLARQIAPVRITGNYGDQVLRQMTMFRPHYSDSGVFAPEFARAMEATNSTYRNAMRGHPLTLASMQQTGWHYYAILSVELSQVEMRSPYLDNDLMRILYRAPGSTLHNNDLRVRLIREGNPVLAKIRTDLGFAGRGGSFASLCSQQLHRATMRAEYACEHAAPRWLANFDRTMLRGQLERTFLGRHKFTHFSLWYRGALAEHVSEMLLDPLTLSRWYVNPARLEAAVRKHVNGGENFTPTIHKLISLEHFHRLFIDAA
ncbi:MAG TPA: asparagine synthase-related protein [Acidobacteriaceae bacterium]|nr:asparagine synthase-related protein [Acidobacteriaceae bacterium]